MSANIMLKVSPYTYELCTSSFYLNFLSIVLWTVLISKFPINPLKVKNQDIKDHLREAGDVYYAEVYGDGTGIVEFARQKDVDTAVEKLDNTKFKSHEVCSPRVELRVLLFYTSCILRCCGHSFINKI